MSDNEINFFKSFLKKDKIVFEWGSGGSTLEFSPSVKEYCSVEHDLAWYKQIFGKVAANTKVYYAPPETNNMEWEQKFLEGEREYFKNYVEFIGKIAVFDKKFDIILIDGRARVDCAREALPYLAENGLVFVHDFDRVYYWRILKDYEIAKLEGTLAVLKKKTEKLNIDRLYLCQKFLL